MNESASTKPCQETIQQFLDAVDTNNSTLMQHLLHGGFAPNFLFDNGFRPLHIAAQAGAFRVISTLLASGAIVECTLCNRKGDCTPLHMAAVSGCTMSVQVLLEAGANPLAGKSGTPL